MLTGATMQTKLLITGATGNVGGEVVRGLTGKAAFRIGALNMGTAGELAGNDVEIVPFDFLEASTFEQTFAGIERMFLVRPPALANVRRDIAPALYAAAK